MRHCLAIPAIFVLALLAGLCLCADGIDHAADASASASATLPPQPNIVFVFIDSLRAESMSCYGYDRPTTPFMDEIAAEGVRFRNYFANSSWTAPTVGTLFTGHHSLRHGRNNVNDQLDGRLPALAEILRGAGYRTIAVTCNAVAGSQWGYQRGFDVFDDFTIPMMVETDLLPDDRPETGEDRLQRLVAAPALDDRMATIALRLLRNVPEGQPYFLFIQMYDPHWDYNPLPEYREMFADPDYAGGTTGDYWLLREHEGAQFGSPEDLRHFINLYDAEIRQTDDAVKRLVATLRERGQLNDTDVLILSADHGEEFMEHGVLSHGKNLFEQGVKVPGIAWSPARWPEGVATDAMASHIDWLPTLARLAGADPPEGLPGEDLFAFREGRWTPPEREGVFMHVMLDEPPHARPMVAIRTKDAKVIRHLDDDSVAVYDLAADPGEQNPLPAAGNEVYEALLAKLDAWHAAERALAELE